MGLLQVTENGRTRVVDLEQPLILIGRVRFTYREAAAAHLLADESGDSAMLEVQPCPRTQLRTALEPGATTRSAGRDGLAIASASDSYESDGMPVRRRRTVWVSAVICMLIAAGSMGGFFYSQWRAEQAAGQLRAHQVAAERQLIRDAQHEIEGLCAGGKYREAQERLATFARRGLPELLRVQLRESIANKARESQDGTLAELSSCLQAGKLDAAKQKLAEARSIQAFTGRPEEALAQAQRGIDHLVESLLRQGSLSILNEARRALGHHQFDEAIRLADEAEEKLADANDPDLLKLRGELKARIGGRLHIQGVPVGAEVIIDGDVSHPYPAAAVIEGLAEGDRSLLVRCVGFRPKTLDAEVAYPDISILRTSLIPIAQGPTWVMRAMEGRPYSGLVRYYYRKTLETGFPGASGDVVGPALASQSPLSDDDLKKRAKNELAKKQNELCLLNKLARLAARNRNGNSIVFEVCQDRLRSILDRAEAGCADCLGYGHLLCASCGGVKNGAKYQVACADSGCEQGVKRHFKCSGTGWARCTACNGTGEVPYSEEINTGGMFTETVNRVRSCRQCARYRSSSKSRGRLKETIKPTEGGGQEREVQTEHESEVNITWTGYKCSCDGGSIACTTCKGDGIQERAGKCPKCDEQGFGPVCSTCSGRGGREDMQVEIRDQMEQALALAVSP